MLTRVTRDL